MVGLLLALFMQNEIDTTYNLCDFRLPDAGTTKLQISVGSWFDQGKGVTYDTNRTTYYSGGDWTGVCRAEYDLRLSSEDRFLELWASTDPYGNWEFRSALFYVDWGRSKGVVGDSVVYESGGDVDIGLVPQLGSYTEAGWYLGNSPWFLGFTDTFNLEWGIDYYDLELWSVFDPQIDVGVFLGGGVGRVRNVAPAAKAWQYLEEIGQVDRDNIDKLGKLLSIKWQYILNHWYYEKYFYPDIEDLLVDQEVISRLDPYQTMRLNEIIAGLPEQRFSGTRLTLGFGGTTMPWYYWFPEGWWWGIQSKVKGGYPISRRWQADWEAIGMIGTQSFEGYEYSVHGSGRLAYYIGERLKISSGLDCRGWYLMDPDPEMNLGGDIPLEVRVFLDNKVYLYTNLVYYFNGRLNTNRPSLSLFQKIHLQVSLTWRLL